MSQPSFGHAWRRPARLLLVLVALGASVTGCQWGTRPKQLLVARGPEGAQVAVRVTGEPSDRLGELLAVDSAGLFLAQTTNTRSTAAFRRLTHIGWQRIRAIDVNQLGGDHDLHPGRNADEALKQRLVLVSRFRVLSPELRQRVLREFGQDTLDVVR